MRRQARSRSRCLRRAAQARRQCRPPRRRRLRSLPGRWRTARQCLQRPPERDVLRRRPAVARQSGDRPRRTLLGCAATTPRQAQRHRPASGRPAAVTGKLVAQRGCTSSRSIIEPVFSQGFPPPPASPGTPLTSHPAKQASRGPRGGGEIRCMDGVGSVKMPRSATRTLVLMPVAIALNIALGSTVQQALKLPIYLDSVGTVLTGVLAGPIAGLATGALTTIIWPYVLPPPLQAPTAGPFAVTAAVIGLLAGFWGVAWALPRASHHRSALAACRFGRGCPGSPCHRLHLQPGLH